jgi:hypothetical protein
LKVYGWRKSPKTKKTQSKHKTKKNKALKRLFGLDSKDVFFHCVLFAIGMQKTNFFFGFW